MAASNSTAPEVPDAKREALIRQALQVHPELRNNPAKLAFMISGAEKRLNTIPTSSLGPQAEQALGAGQDATQITPGQARGSLIVGIGNMIGDLATTLRVNAAAGNLMTGARQDALSPEQAVAQAQQSQAVMQSLKPEEQASVMRGTALLAGIMTSAAVGPVARAITAPGIVGRVGAAILADETGGAVYGVTAPHPGQSTAGAAMEGAVNWGVMGGGATAAHLGTDALGQWFASMGAAKTAVDVARDAIRTGGTTPAHGIAILDAATDVAASKIKPLEITAKPTIATVAQPLDPVLDVPLARVKAPYAGVPATAEVPTTHQAARAFDAASTIVPGSKAPTAAEKLWDGVWQNPDVQAHLSTIFGEGLPEPAAVEPGAARAGETVKTSVVPGSATNDELQHKMLEVEGTRATPPVPKNAMTLADMTGASTWARANDARKGFITARLLSAGTGLAIRSIPQGANEPDGIYAVRKELGGLLLLGAAASAAPDLAAWARGTKTGIASVPAGIAERTATAWDAARMLQTPGSRDAFEGLKGLFTGQEEYLSSMERRLQDAFGTAKDSPARRAASYAVGPEGQVPGNPHMASLTPKQQGAVQWLHGLLDNTGDILEQRGLINGKIEHYLSHMLPEEVMTKLRGGNSQSVAGLSVTPGFTQSRKLFSMTEFQRYLAESGLPRANEDVVDLTMNHMRSYFRVIRNDAILNAAEAQGWMVPFDNKPATVSRLMPAGDLAGWQKLSIGYKGQSWVAPKDVADAIETLNTRTGAKGPIGAAYDAFQSAAMRGIMFNPVIHGANELRAAMAAGVGPSAYMRWRDMVANNDPFVQYAASKGVIVTGRATEGVRLRDSFDQLMGSLGRDDLTHGALYQQLGKFADWNEQMLFGDRGLVSNVAGASFYTQRLNFMARHPEVLPGTPAFDAAERKFASYANDVSGRVNQLMRTEGMKTFMRRVFFAPQWLETRWNLTLGALKEVGDPAIMKNVMSHPLDFAQSMLPGQLGGKGTDAIYLQYKMRSLALTAAFTYAISQALTGKPPVFDPKTARFAAHTGAIDQKGQEVMWDPSGIWDEDLRAFNMPGSYLTGKLAFAVRAGPQFLASQDPYGKPLSGAENIEQFLASFGGLGQTAETGMRLLANKRAPNAKELLGLAPSLLGAGSVSSMPDPGSMLLSKVARGILSNTGLPTDDNRVWELSTLMRHAIERGGSPIDNRILFWVGNQRRELQQRSPGASMLYHGITALKQLFAGSSAAQ